MKKTEKKVIRKKIPLKSKERFLIRNRKDAIRFFIFDINWDYKKIKVDPFFLKIKQTFKYSDSTYYLDIVRGFARVFERLKKENRIRIL